MDLENTVNEEQEPQQEPGKNKGFIWGVITGIMSTAAVLGLAFCICHFGMGYNISLTKGVAGSGSVVSVLDAETVGKINELTAYIGTYYYDDVYVDDLKEGLYEGLLEGIGDKYSVYYDAEAYKSMQADTTMTFYGIGAGLIQDAETMEVSISKVYEGTPAEEAGLMNGDYIVSVDDVDATSMELTDLVKLIRGEEGTSVHLEVYRESTDETLSFDVIRKNITVPTVSYEMMDGDIGYIDISSFASATAKEFEEAVAELDDLGMTSMIIDLRYNSGGLVDSVVQILDDILPEGIVVYTEDKNGNRQEYRSDDSTSISLPIAVLVNGSSASASEIFAGAIKDYGYGTLIGTTTYGKGIMQTIFPLSDGDAVKLTTAKYFTPNGNYIHGVGIEPDIELEYEFLDPDATEYDAQYDNQIQKAIEVLREQ